MSDVYFDTVLNERMVPIKYGTTKDVLGFLRANASNTTFKVLMGEAGRVVTAEKYVEWEGVPLSQFAKEIKKNNRLMIQKFIERAMEYAMNPPKGEKVGDPQKQLELTVDRVMNIFYADGPY